ncbi:MAG: hypothetical protein AB1469_09210 [Pseudomonadota bacterium]
MSKKNELKTVEFSRKVRDKQASELANKNHKEILDYFSAFRKFALRPNTAPKPAIFLGGLNSHR